MCWYEKNIILMYFNIFKNNCYYIFKYLKKKKEKREDVRTLKWLGVWRW